MINIHVWRIKMSFLEKLEQAENELDKDVKSWKEEREKAVKNIPFVVDINPEKSRRKDQKQFEMYKDSYYSGF